MLQVQVSKQKNVSASEFLKMHPDPGGSGKVGWSSESSSSSSSSSEVSEEQKGGVLGVKPPPRRVCFLHPLYFGGVTLLCSRVGVFVG